MKAKSRYGSGGAKNGGDDGGNGGGHRGMHFKRKPTKPAIAARKAAQMSASTGTGTVAGGGGKK